MNALEELKTLSGDLVNPALEKWKAEGKKVVGFFCSYVPEEILYAADILPVRVRAPGCESTTSADVYFSPHNCSFMRSCLDFALEGKYGFLDGIVFTNSCDNVRRVHDTLKEVCPEKFPFLEFISVPHKTTDQSISFYRNEMASFLTRVEVFSGVKITEDRLKNAIDVYNRTRRLLKKVYALRQSSNPRISGADSLRIVATGLSIPKDRYNELLEKLITELNETDTNVDYRARLMVAGSGGCEDPTYFQIIEELGGLIVADSLCFGSRYFWKPVEINGDILHSLATSYMNRPSCASMGDRVVERSQYIQDMAKEFKVDGVIFERMRYCDLWGGQILHLRNELKEANIPLLELEREYFSGATGQLRTRAQAFLERIEG